MKQVSLRHTPFRDSPASPLGKPSLTASPNLPLLGSAVGLKGSIEDEEEGDEEECAKQDLPHPWVKEWRFTPHLGTTTPLGRFHE